MPSAPSGKNVYVTNPAEDSFVYAAPPRHHRRRADARPGVDRRRRRRRWPRRALVAHGAPRRYRQVYVAGFDDNAIAVFCVADATTGRLTYSSGSSPTPAWSGRRPGVQHGMATSTSPAAAPGSCSGSPRTPRAIGPRRLQQRRRPRDADVEPGLRRAQLRDGTSLYVTSKLDIFVAYAGTRHRQLPGSCRRRCRSAMATPASRIGGPAASSPAATASMFRRGRHRHHAFFGRDPPISALTVLQRLGDDGPPDDRD